MKETQNNEKNTKLMLTICYSMVALIYFANAAYSYFYKIEDQVIVNIGLGIMFMILGIVSRTPN